MFGSVTEFVIVSQTLPFTFLSAGSLSAVKTIKTTSSALYSKIVLGWRCVSTTTNVNPSRIYFGSWVIYCIVWTNTDFAIVFIHINI